MESIKIVEPTKIEEKNPHEVIDGLEVILERLIASPLLKEEERDTIRAVRGWSNLLARATLEEPSEQMRNKIFQEYIPGLRGLLSDDTLWDHLGKTLPSIDLNKDKAKEFLESPENCFGPSTTEEEKQCYIKKAQKILRGTPIDEVKTELGNYITQLEQLFLAQVSSPSSISLN